MKKLFIILGVVGIMTAALAINATKDTSTDLGDKVISLIPETLPGDLATALTTEGLEEFFPWGPDEEPSPLAALEYGDVVASHTWSSMGIPSGYRGAGVTIDRTRKYVYLANQLGRMYVIDISGGVSVTPSIAAWCAPADRQRIVWGMGQDSEGDIWYSDIQTNFGWDREYDPYAAGTWCTPTGNSFNVFASMGYYWSADMAENHASDHLFQVRVGCGASPTSNIYEMDQSGSVIRNFGHSSWNYTCARALSYSPCDNAFFVGGWNTSSMWEINSTNGAAIPGRNLGPYSWPQGAIAGAAFDDMTSGGPYLWVNNNQFQDILYVYYVPCLAADDIACQGHAKPNFPLQSAGEPLELEVNVANLGTQDQNFTVNMVITRKSDNVEMYNETEAGFLAALSQGSIVMPDWADGPEVGVGYLIESSVSNPGDENTANDDCETSVTGSVACEQIAYDDGTYGNAFYWFSSNYISAASFDGTQPPPVRMVWGAVNTITAGEPFYPWPNAIYDPVELVAWEATPGGPKNGLVNKLAEWDTVPTDDPSWIVWSLGPTEAISASGSIALGFRNTEISSARREGLATDNARNFFKNYYSYNLGNNWFSYSGYGDWHIRACVDYPPCLEIVGPPVEVLVDFPEPCLEPTLVELHYDMVALCRTTDVTFFLDDLRHTGDPNKIIDALSATFVPPVIAVVEAGESVHVMGLLEVPCGTFVGTYEGYMTLYGQTSGGPLTETKLTRVIIGSPIDLDIHDNYANLTGNTMELVGTVGGMAFGSFVIVDPSNAVNNYDPWDGPSTQNLNPIAYANTDLTSFAGTKDISSGNVGVSAPATLLLGQSGLGVVAITIPGNGDVHKCVPKDDKFKYHGTVSAEHTGISDEFSVTLCVTDGSGSWSNSMIRDRDERGITLSWSDFDFAESFNVYRSDGSGIYTKLNDAPLPENTSYTDANVIDGVTYEYKFGIILPDGEEATFPLTVGPNVRPTSATLLANVPNPMNTETVIRYGLPADADVSLKVYDLTGSLVKTLVNGSVDAGYYSALWNGTNEAGQTVANGVYFYRLTAGDFSQSRKMVVLR
jgi:hypothetical protein